VTAFLLDCLRSEGYLSRQNHHIMWLGRGWNFRPLGWYTTLNPTELSSQVIAMLYRNLSNIFEHLLSAIRIGWVQMLMRVSRSVLGHGDSGYPGNATTAEWQRRASDHSNVRTLMTNWRSPNRKPLVLQAWGWQEANCLPPPPENNNK